MLYQDDVVFICKFGCVNTCTEGQLPPWLSTWWKDFGVNKEEADPTMLSLFTPLQQVRDLYFQGPNDEELLQIYIMNHYQWGIQIKTSLQRMQGHLSFVRKIYTKAWDTLYYPERFNSHIEND